VKPQIQKVRVVSENIPVKISAV